MTLASALRALQTSFPQFLCVAKKPHYLHDTSWRYVCVFPHIFRSCIPFAGAPFLAGSKRHLGGLIVCCMPVLGVSSLNSGRACHGPFFWLIVTACADRAYSAASGRGSTAFA